MDQRERLQKIREQWNRRAATFPKELGADGKELLDFLETELGLQHQTLLDVGCGTGRYMAEFLRRGGRHAIGVKISENMIEEGERMFSAQGFPESSYRFICAPWEDVDIQAEELEASLDLVLAVNTPALDTVEGIEKMVACARWAVCLVSFIDRTDLFYQEIHRLYYGTEKSFKTSKVEDMRAFFDEQNLRYRFDILERVRPGIERIDSILPRYAHWLFGDGGTAKEQQELCRILKEKSEDGENIRYTFWSRKGRLLYRKDQATTKETGGSHALLAETT